MNLYLRKVIHPQAHENYRVILKGEDGEFEVGVDRHPARRRVEVGN